MAACLLSGEGPLCGIRVTWDKLLLTSDTKVASPHMGIQSPIVWGENVVLTSSPHDACPKNHQLFIDATS